MEDHDSNPNQPNTVDVYIQVSFTKVYDIDTINQRFQAEAIIESKWHETSLKSIHDTIDVQKIWKPDFYIENAINDVKEEVRYKVVNNQNSLMIYEIRKVKGTFWEKLELESFPLDIQDLNLVVATRKSGSKINLILMQPEFNFLKISSTLDSSMWHLNNVVKSSKEKIYREFSYGDREYPACTVSLQAFRSPGFLYWNAVLPIFLITLASLGPFVIDFKLPQSRLPSTCTLLLTSVSFRTVVGRFLPGVSYLTSLDKYALASMMIITMQLLYHALIAALYQSLSTVLATMVHFVGFQSKQDS